MSAAGPGANLPALPRTRAFACSAPKISLGVFSFLPHGITKVEQRVEGLTQTDLGISQKTSF